MDDTLRLSILQRTNLDLSPDKAVAPSGHVVERLLEQASPEIRAAWIAGRQTKVTLALPNEAAWRRAIVNARAAWLPCAPIHDAGRTGIAAGMPTAVGIGPYRWTDLAGVLRRLLA